MRHQNPSTEQGISAVIIILAIAVIGLVGLMGVYVFSVGNGTTKDDKQSSSDNSETTDRKETLYFTVESFKVRAELKGSARTLAPGIIKESTLDPEERIIPINAPTLEDTWLCKGSDGKTKANIGSITVTTKVKRVSTVRPILTKKIGDKIYDLDFISKRCANNDKEFDALTKAFKTAFDGLAAY